MTSRNTGRVPQTGTTAEISERIGEHIARLHERSRAKGPPPRAPGVYRLRDLTGPNNWRPSFGDPANATLTFEAIRLTMGESWIAVEG